MKDILYGLIGIIMALAVFAGGVYIGAGYLNQARAYDLDETTEEEGAVDTTPVYTVESEVPETQTSYSADNTVRAETTVQDFSTASPSKTTPEEISAEVSVSLDQLLTELNDLLVSYEDEGIHLELSYNYTQKIVTVFMIPTGDEASLFYLDNLLGGEESMQAWEEIVAVVNEISSMLQQGLYHRGFTDVTSYVQLLDTTDYDRSLLTSQNGIVIYDFFEDTGWVFGRNTSAQVSDGNNSLINQNSSKMYESSSSENFSSYNDLPDHVWLSATGDQFHNKNACGNMNPDNARLVTLQYAQSHGFMPCDTCFPGVEKSLMSMPYQQQS